MHTDSKAFVLGSLRVEHCEQFALDLHFRAGEKVRFERSTRSFCAVLSFSYNGLNDHHQLGFSVSGSSSIHLTGNMIPDLGSECARLFNSLYSPDRSDEDFDDSEVGGHNRAKLRAQLREYLGDEASEGEEDSHTPSSEGEAESLDDSEELAPLPQKRKAQEPAPKEKAPEGAKPATPKQGTPPGYADRRETFCKVYFVHT